MRRKRAAARTPEPERFFSFVDMKKKGCWIWKGGRAGGRGDETSYGYFRVRYKSDGNRRQVYAHRWSFEYFGGEIAKGEKVLHDCDNPLCVNPDHLYAGTQSNNVQDMHDRGRAAGTQLGGHEVWRKRR